ncbi:hypothetical protein SAMN05216420_11037 [Nitrosospira sp. Nl5]|uniref:hypothetical protein n=1 Tax=Nitrosospira sp. Nl5 TaxID=200120 RepID=UPI00088FB76A|nr:hypothetical protein [Nitrosospira sp. Nl5]SCY61304.1 hypothetical protein SAMN05216420_11037 [Nitrosospira sp. Nl5]
MKITSILTAKSLVLGGSLIFSITSMGVVQARECDMPDSIAAGDSATVRDTDCGPGEGEKKKQRATSSMSSDSKRDNSRYSTDGTERYTEDNKRDEGYNGTGPKREGRY